MRFIGAIGNKQKDRVILFYEGGVRRTITWKEWSQMYQDFQSMK